MKSASQHTFARIPSVDIPRSSFKRSLTYKTTFDAGLLIPFYLDEIIPGDTFNFRLSALARILSPLKYPIMDNLYMDFQFFFVPTRLVYDDYEKFFGSSKGQSGNWEYDDSHLMPGVQFTGSITAGSLGDYFGLPLGVSGLRVNALPFRAYNKIINDWYLPSVYEMTGPTIKTDSTDDSPSIYNVVKRIKRCDQFTSSLISPQRGPGASIGLAGTAGVYGDGNSLAFATSLTSTLSPAFLYVGQNNTVTGVGKRTSSSAVPVGSTDSSMNVATGTAAVTRNSLGLATKEQVLNNASGSSGLYADLDSASAISINSLRQAFQLQRALERDMRGGVQYVSQLMAHFGVRSPDARLQRTEYLGGGSMPVNVHTVANTSGAGVNDQASLAAFGVASRSNAAGWVKSFTEHGYVIGLVSVRADLTYQQGIPKLFDRWSRFDHYYPVFAHLGEQPVLNKEIFAQSPTVIGDSGKPVNDEVFGYQERYFEYRYGLSKITGQLRSTYSAPLDAWHLSQKFNNLPVLNHEFLEENVPMSRVKAVQDTPDFLFDSVMEINCVRPMPLFGVPGLVDHF